MTGYFPDGSVMTCKCGKPAGCAMIAKDSYFAWCKDCDPLIKYEARLVYRADIPHDPIEKKIVDSWTIDIRKKK